MKGKVKVDKEEEGWGESEEEEKVELVEGGRGGMEKRRRYC